MDLLGRTTAHATAPRSVSSDLSAIERAFAAVPVDEGAGPGTAAARERAHARAALGGDVTQALALDYASDLFVTLALERRWSRLDVDELVARLSADIGMPATALRVELLVSSLNAAQLIELSPGVALETQLAILVALSPATEASLWMRDVGGRVRPVVAIGETAGTRRFRTVAKQALAGEVADSGERGTIVGVPVRRWQAPCAALVVRAQAQSKLTSLFTQAADALTPILEREDLLRRSAARERALVTASEKRLGRLGFDLHDGALQQVAMLGTEIQLLRGDVERELTAIAARGVSQRLGRLYAGARELDRALRELAHSLEPASLLRRPLARVVESEAAALVERTGVDAELTIQGDFDEMTASQRIALIRVIQEALSNIREHSNAQRVEISVAATRRGIHAEVRDDGDGFDVARTLIDAAQRGRLGVVGSSERVRLLGGTFDIQSRLGGPTVVSVSLPWWHPLVASADAPGEVHALAFS